MLFAVNYAETDLAAAVVDLLSHDHDVYQEVKIAGGTVDIVAKRGPILWAVEVKKSTSLAVLGQALRNHGWFHYSSIAVPDKRRRGRGEDAAFQFMKQNGIGKIEIQERRRWNKESAEALGWEYRLEASEVERASFNRRAFTKWVQLYEQQKIFAPAGTNGGGAFTPFKGTRVLLLEFVTAHPGCTIKEAMSAIDHHYHKLSTAMSCVREYIKTGVIDEIRNEDGRLYTIGGET